MKGGYFNPNPDTQPQETEKGISLSLNGMSFLI